jgi:2-dehydro-3-deoxygalactonokinase
MLSDELFISCDWGTSNFRLRLVEKSGLQVIAEIKLPNGIAMMNTEWKEKHADSGVSKEIFFLEFLEERIKAWDQTISPGQSIPIVISGMASSSIGIRELDYSSIPYQVSGASANTEWIQSSTLIHPVLLVSGVRTDDDVMRGEETQLTGLVKLIQIEKDRKQLFILPGTHSKHIFVDQGQITDFKTYMTGEMFALISKNSILSNSVTANKVIEGDAVPQQAFRKGVRSSINNNLLHTLFTVRTNQLFKQLRPDENYFYLSGLIIGSELAAIQNEIQQLVIAGEGSLVSLYEAAIDELGLIKQLTTIPGKLIEAALIAGHFELLKTHPLK